MLPVHVREEASYGRHVYLGLTLQRDLFGNWLEKSFDGQQVQARLDRTSLSFGPSEVTQPLA